MVQGEMPCTSFASPDLVWWYVSCIPTSQPHAPTPTHPLPHIHTYIRRVHLIIHPLPPLLSFVFSSLHHSLPNSSVLFFLPTHQAIHQLTTNNIKLIIKDFYCWVIYQAWMPDISWVQLDPCDNFLLLRWTSNVTLASGSLWWLFFFSLTFFPTHI